MRRHRQATEEKTKPDLLICATFCSTRGAEYEECLLYLGSLTENSMTVSSDKDWTVGSLVYLQLDFPQEGQRDLYLTCKVKKCTPHLGGLSLYELKFFRLPDAKKAEVARLLKPYVAPSGRKYYRHYCSNPFEIAIRLDHSTQPVEDISCGGLNFSGADKYEVGGQIESKLFFDSFTFLTQIRVDWRAEKGNGYWEYGCSFQEVKDVDSKQLKDYIYRRAVKHSGVAC